MCVIHRCPLSRLLFNIYGEEFVREASEDLANKCWIKADQGCGFQMTWLRGPEATTVYRH